jgi:hypothetical protein
MAVVARCRDGNVVVKRSGCVMRLDGVLAKNDVDPPLLCTIPNDLNDLNIKNEVELGQQGEALEL